MTDTAIDTAVRTLWGECRGEPMLGQAAVAWVIRNRAEWTPHAWWGSTILDVCRHPWQFSCWNAGSSELAAMKALPESDPTYQKLTSLMQRVLTGHMADPSNGATCYQRVGTGASWSRGRPISIIIGGHEFYRIPPEG